MKLGPDIPRSGTDSYMEIIAKEEKGEKRKNNAHIPYMGFLLKKQEKVCILTKCRGSSVVERSPEEAGVVSSILTRGIKISRP